MGSELIGVIAKEFYTGNKRKNTKRENLKRRRIRHNIYVQQLDAFPPTYLSRYELSVSDLVGSGLSGHLVQCFHDQANHRP